MSSGFVDSISLTIVHSLRRDSTPCREMNNSILESHNPLNSSFVSAISMVDTEFTSWLRDDKGEKKEVFLLELEMEEGEIEVVWFGLGVGVRNCGGESRVSLSLRENGDEI